jgi:hypothetical protein
MCCLVEVMMVGQLFEWDVHASPWYPLSFDFESTWNGITTCRMKTTNG